MNPERDASRTTAVMGWFLLLTYGLSWSIAVPAALVTLGFLHHSVARGLQTAAQFAPAAAALILAGCLRGRISLGVLLRKLLVVRVHAGLYAVALLLAPVTQAVSLLLYRAMGQKVPQLVPWSEGLALLFVLTLFSVGEELGWRGFLLPLLLQRYSAVAATVWMALLWGLWHLPFYLSISPEGSRTGWLYLLFLAGMFPVCAVFTLLYVRTGSVLLCMVFHGSLNAGVAYWFGHLPTGELRPFALWIVLMWLLAIPVTRALAGSSSP